MPISKRKAVTTAISLTVFNAAFRFLLSTTYSDKSSFSSALSFAEGEILWFSGVVAFGVYGEAKQTIWWRDRHALFAWWVALGLIGELMADAQVWRASASLQTASDTLLADAVTKASAANTTAGNAQLAVASASERAASLEQKAAELTARNLELEKAITPRTIDQGAMDASLRSFSGVSFKVETVSDFEARRLGATLSTSLAEAGWIGTPCQEATFPDGVKIAYLKNIDFDQTTYADRLAMDKSESAAEALASILSKDDIQAHASPVLMSGKHIDFNFEGLFTPDMPLGTIIVAIGAKPMTPFLEQEKTDEIRGRGESNVFIGNTMRVLPDTRPCPK